MRSIWTGQSMVVPKTTRYRRTFAASENEVTGTSHVCLSTPKYVVVYQAQAVNATELSCVRKTTVSNKSIHCRHATSYIPKQ